MLPPHNILHIGHTWFFKTIIRKNMWPTCVFLEYFTQLCTRDAKAVRFKISDSYILLKSKIYITYLNPSTGISVQK